MQFVNSLASAHPHPDCYVPCSNNRNELLGLIDKAGNLPLAVCFQVMQSVWNYRTFCYSVHLNQKHTFTQCLAILPLPPNTVANIELQ